MLTCQSSLSPAVSNSVYWFHAGKSTGKILLRLVIYYNRFSKQPGLPVAENMDRNEGLLGDASPVQGLLGADVPSMPR